MREKENEMKAKQKTIRSLEGFVHLQDQSQKLADVRRNEAIPPEIPKLSME